MQRTALKIIVSVAFVLGLIATPASAAAAPPACGNPGPVTAHDGSSTWIWLGATCQDADLDYLTFEIVTPPEHGELTETDEFGYVQYTPEPGYTGPDSFQFRANDGDEVSATLTIDITVEPNVPPECNGDTSVDVEPDRPNPLWLFCFDPDSCCELTYTVVDPPQHGVLGDFDEFEGFTYTPEPGYHGPDSLTITASDGVDDSDPFTVDITVLGPNNPPTCATPLTLRVAKGGTLPLARVDRVQRPGRRPDQPGARQRSEPRHVHVPERRPLVYARTRATPAPIGSSIA